VSDAVAMWCTDCGIRLRQVDIKGWGCPKCGSQGIPCAPDKDVFVEVNWHELHILCCWAEFWAAKHADSDDESSQKMPKTVRAIARRLEQQWPNMGALTLGGELADLPGQMADRGIKIGAVETNLPTAGPVLELGPGAVGFARQKDVVNE
jgi:hypothetical protein